MGGGSAGDDGGVGKVFNCIFTAKLSIVMERKIKTYMFSGEELVEEEEDFKEVVRMVAYAATKSVRNAEDMVERWISEGRKIIYFYPALSDRDISGFECIGFVPDGGMYLG